MEKEPIRKPVINIDLELIDRILFSGEEIKTKIREIAEEIYKNHDGEEILLIGILKGGARFLSDLTEDLGKGDPETGRKPRNVKVGYLGVSSYGNRTTSSGKVKQTFKLDTEIESKNVILVEDIVDSGLTLQTIIEEMKRRNPKSIEVCVLLDKKVKRQVNVPLHYRGFVIPDEFVVGYGLDYIGDYRTLPYIGVLKGPDR